MTNEYDEIIAEASTRWDVPFNWIKAVIGVESNFNPRAVREEPAIGDRSIGLMQLLTRTAQGLGFLGSEEDLFDPATNIDLGTRLLGQWRRTLGDDFAAVYSAYNSGRPTLYLTSSTVRAHVNNALAWLRKVSSSTSPAALAILIGLIIYLFRRPL